MAMRALVISAIVLVAVVMGMSAMAPAFAGGPPSDPRAGENPPEIDCEELEALLEASNASDKAKDKIRERAGCD